jgi:hypothetical protein
MSYKKYGFTLRQGSQPFHPADMSFAHNTEANFVTMDLLLRERIKGEKEVVSRLTLWSGRTHHPPETFAVVGCIKQHHSLYPTTTSSC